MISHSGRRHLLNNGGHVPENCGVQESYSTYFQMNVEKLQITVLQFYNFLTAYDHHTNTKYFFAVCVAGDVTKPYCRHACHCKIQCCRILIKEIVL